MKKAIVNVLYMICGLPHWRWVPKSHWELPARLDGKHLVLKRGWRSP